MSEDKSGKTEQPTSHKLKQAREQGQVPKSKDIASTASLVVLFTYMALAGSFMWETLLELFQHASTSPAADFDSEYGTIIDHVYEAIWYVAVPPAIVAALTGIIANVGQFGILFVTKPITPEMEKINPIAGFKRIFALNNLMETVKSIVKVLLLGLCFYFIIKMNIGNLLDIIYCDLACAMQVGKHITAYVLVAAMLIFMVLAIMDFAYQKWQHIKNNMMSFDEVKRDRKMTDGDPMIKQRLRSEMRTAANDNLKERVEGATIFFRPSNSDFVIGLFYKQGQTPLPLVTVIEKNMIAQKIFGVAGMKKIPVVEHSELSMKLLEKAKLHNYIPSDLIQITAKTMAKHVKLG